MDLLEAKLLEDIEDVSAIVTVGEVVVNRETGLFIRNLKIRTT